MAKSIDLGAYPMEYFQALEEAARSGTSEYKGTMAEMQALRFDLYAFRKALLRANHRLAVMVRPLRFIIREEADGSAKLFITRSDNSPSAQLLREQLRNPISIMNTLPSFESDGSVSVVGPAIPGITPAEEKPNVDPMETALNKLGFFTRGGK